MNQVGSYRIRRGGGGAGERNPPQAGKRIHENRSASQWWAALLVVLTGAWFSVAVVAQPRLLDVLVEGIDGEPLKGIWLRLAGDEPDARVRGGSVTLLLPPHVQPGDDVQLLLQDERYAFLEPRKGLLRVPSLRVSQPPRIVLVRRGDTDLLPKDEVRRSLGRQVVVELDVKRRREGTLSQEDRLETLQELGLEYGLDPEEIDHALQAWQATSLEEKNRQLLERYLEYFPRAVESVGGAVRFTGPVRFGDDSVVVINPSETLIIDQPSARFFLRLGLEDLALGEASTLEVGAAPAWALEGAECSWEIRPANYLIIVGDVQRDCSLAVAMPEAPLSRYGPRVELRVTAAISRGGILQDEIREAVTVNNGVAVRAHITGAPLTPGGGVLVAITQPGFDAPLSAEYRCTWSTVRSPIRWTSTAENDCAVRIEVSSPDDWGTVEMASWQANLDRGRSPNWVVTTSYRGQPIPGGEIKVDIQVEDPRGEGELHQQFGRRLREETLEGMKDRQAEGIDAHLRRAGLPPLSEITASSLRLRAEVGSDGWRLQALYVGEDGSDEKVLVSGKTVALKVLYSHDGEGFSPFGYVGRPRDLQTLAGLHHYWVKLEVPTLKNLNAGPFRLKLDGAAELRAAVRRYWKELSEEERRDLACNSFVLGAGPPNVMTAARFLPVLQSASVRRKDGSVWRTATYSAELSLLSEKSFQRVPRPMGGGAYAVRLAWTDGSQDEIECPAGRQLGYAKDGMFHTLQRVASGDEKGPPQIEVYVEEEWNGKWRIQYEHLFKPSFIRVATDGKTFATSKPNYQFKNAVLVEEPKGDILHLRFVAEDGSEVGYRGTLAFDEHRRAVLLKNLLVTLDLTCNLVDGAGDPAPAGEGAGVRCQILTNKGWGMQRAGPIKLGQVAPILRHIQFGCAKDRLDEREDYAELKAKGIDLKRLYLSFRMEKPCETVYAQMVLDDGSKSQVLVIPVLTGDSGHDSDEYDF